MNKLKLTIDALEVESFSVAAERAAGGTVRGLEYSSAGPMQCGDACFSESPCYSREPSCEDTCMATCEYTCFCMSPVWACITEGGEAC
ncbi:MAG TPA: hypothetical protein VEX86_20210 [Longimicrobium sp.]|nr:hypothetical protein [Longimicrobium sp.]